jgi:queuine tRNA-ribosyltransferase
VLTPELAVDIQGHLGSDIAMVLDECLEHPATHKSASESLERTLRWAKRSRDHFLKFRETKKTPDPFFTNVGQAQFGIIQGGTFPDLRTRSVEGTLEVGFEAYAIGGLSVGEPIPLMYDITEHTAQMLPPDQPRYLMGAGTPVDLVESAARGIDMFDCVMPTRSGRHCQAFTWGGRLNLRNARYAEDATPLDPESACPAAQYERAYLHHLVRSNEALGAMLLTYANVQFYQELMARARQAIEDGRFASFADEVVRRYREIPAEEEADA